MVLTAARVPHWTGTTLVTMAMVSTVTTDMAQVPGLVTVCGRGRDKTVSIITIYHTDNRMVVVAMTMTDNSRSRSMVTTILPDAEHQVTLWT